MSDVHDLLGFLRGHRSVAIVCHDNPDPDCLASAAALAAIANESDIPETHILYSEGLSINKTGRWSSTSGPI